MFREDTMYLFGQSYKTALDLVPQRFALTLKGKDLIGSPRNDVIFSPAIDPHEKLVMWLQAKGGGLVSDKRSEERRVGKECRSRWWPYHVEKTTGTVGWDEVVMI